MKQIFGFILLLCFYNALLSQSTENFSINKAVNTALLRNPEIAILQKNIEKEKKVLPKFKNNPEFGVTLNNNLNPSQTFYKGADISVSMPIEIMGQNRIREKILELNVKIAEIELKKFKADLSYQVANKFTEIYFTKRKIKEIQHLLDISNNLLNQTQSRAKAGQISPLNLNSAILQSALLSDDIVSVKNDLSEQKSELEGIMNAKISQDAKFVFNMEENSDDIQSVIRTAKENNSQIAILKFKTSIDSLQISLLDIQNKFSEMTPSLSLSQEGKNISTGIGVSFPIPIFNKRVSEKNTLHSKISITNLEIKKLDTQLENDIKKYYSNLINYKKRIDNYKTKIIPISQKNLELSKTLYSNG